MRFNIRSRPILSVATVLCFVLVALLVIADASADRGSPVDRVPEADPPPLMLAPEAAFEPTAAAAPVAPSVAKAPEQREPSRAQLSRRLSERLGERLTVWSRPDGSPVYVSHCRTAPGGCEARIRALSALLVDAAANQDLDPYLLAAVALRESGLHPGAVGPAGEAGIVQLHPRGVGAGVRYVSDADYRAVCAARRPAACQKVVVRTGARHLSDWIASCGSVEAGLGGYNRGRCGTTPYSGRVLAEHARLRAGG